MKENSPKLGQLLDHNAARDAIHFAVAPVVVSDEEPLEGGTPVCFKIHGNTEIVCRAAWHMAVGILDPFLKVKVKPGEACWMMLMPNTITGLRHEWTHPAFEDEQRAVSEFWLREFCDEHGLSYKYVMEEFAQSDVVGTGDNEISLYAVERDELARHLSIVLGRQVNSPRFSCAC